jgi:hypothetical protein
MVDIPTTQKLQQKLKIPFSLRLSDTGEINLKGDIKPEHLQAVLDASQLRLKICQEHEERLNRENNLAAIYIGFIVSSLLGLSIFCLFNQSPKVQTQSSIIGVLKC